MSDAVETGPTLDGIKRRAIARHVIDPSKSYADVLWIILAMMAVSDNKHERRAAYRIARDLRKFQLGKEVELPNGEEDSKA